jgi:hypothetical protein
MSLATDRLGLRLAEMSADPIAPRATVHLLRASLAEHYQRSEYLKCESMGELIRENLESIRREVLRAPATAPLSAG